MRKHRILCIALALVLAAFAFPRVASAKDLDNIKFIHLAPVITEQESPLFPVYVKSELVHEGFTVLPKPDKADAVLTIELVITKKDGGFEIEAHGKLEEPDQNILWTGSVIKSGPDQDKLISTVARQIVSKLKGAKMDEVAKKDEKNNKESKQPH